MSRPLQWEVEGRIWPHRDASRFVEVGPVTWHIQRFGEDCAQGARPSPRPRILMLHGTGASVHSWRDLAPCLADRFDILACDLPRHAFTRGHLPDDTSLVRMARSVRHLLDACQFAPDMVVGHSAGAALALQIAFDHEFRGPIVGLNSALRPFPGLAAQMFPAIAKVLFVNPVVPRLFSAAAGFGNEAERFIGRATRSRIDRAGLACYAALLRNSHHTKGALAMMANWDLPGLRHKMDRITNPILLLHSDKDATIPLEWAQEAHSWLATSRLDVLSGLGHLAHEEAPDLAAGAIADFASTHLGAGA